MMLFTRFLPLIFVMVVQAMLSQLPVAKGWEIKRWFLYGGVDALIAVGCYFNYRQSKWIEAELRELRKVQFEAIRRMRGL